MTDDLEKQADSDSDDGVDGDDDSRKVAVERRFRWVVMAFVWFSALDLFFPTSALGDHGFLSRRPSVPLFSGDNEPGPNCYQKDRVSASGLIRVLSSL